jgi:hypothetical protein
MKKFNEKMLYISMQIASCPNVKEAIYSMKHYN